MARNLSLLVCLILFSGTSRSVLVNVTVAQADKKIAVVFGDKHVALSDMGLRAPERQSEAALLFALLENSDVLRRHLLIEWHRSFKEAGLRTFTNLLSDILIPGPFKNTIIEDIEVRGCSELTGSILDKPRFFIEEKNKAALEAAFGANLWQLNYNDVFAKFDEVCLTLEAKKDLHTSERIRGQFDDKLSLAHQEFQRLQRAPLGEYGYTPDQALIAFVNKTSDYITSRSDLNEWTKCIKALKKQTNAAFIPLFDLNAYHRILELHSSEDCVISIVGDQHRETISRMLEQSADYKIVYTTGAHPDPTVHANKANYREFYQTILDVLIPEHAYPLTAEHFDRLAGYVRGNE